MAKQDRTNTHLIKHLLLRDQELEEIALAEESYEASLSEKERIQQAAELEESLKDLKPF